MEKNPSFLKKKFQDLHTSPEVASSVHRTTKRTKEAVPQKPEVRIQAHLDRFTEIINRPDPAERERGLEALKQVLHKKHLVAPDVATDVYLKRQQTIAREQGHGDVTIPTTTRRQVEQAVTRIALGHTTTTEATKDFPNEQKQLVEEITALIEEQQTSLDQWVDYLASPDATYPDWLKYFTMRSIVSLSSYDKDEKVFPKRTAKTTNPFPDLNREALAYVLDAILQKQTNTRPTKPRPLTKDDDAFETYLQGENFAKLYAFAIEKVTPASDDLLTVTTGTWKKYPKGSDARPLVDSLQGHGTGWCTAGESVAASQLSRGDFYVYYSHDEDKQATIPRAAIRMEDDEIAEVRGIAPNQHLDSYISPVVQKKMREFPDGAQYEKKAGDMQRLTQLEQKVKAKKPLTKDDLIFLYEIDQNIEGFGYNRDPRIQELLSKRDQVRDIEVVYGYDFVHPSKSALEFLYGLEAQQPAPVFMFTIDKLLSKRDQKADASIVFDCAPQDIAWGKDQLTNDTKAYIGPLFPNIFAQLKHLEHIYTSFPEGKIRQTTFELSGKTNDEYQKALDTGGFKYSKHMLKNMPSLGLPESASSSHGVVDAFKNLFTKKKSEAKPIEQIRIVRLRVLDLGFPQGTKFKNIYPKAQELGLELCPAQVGPERRLQYTSQPMGEYEFVAMEPIADQNGGNPDVFSVRHDGDGVCLDGFWAGPNLVWNPNHYVLFRLRE